MNIVKNYLIDETITLKKAFKEFKIELKKKGLLEKKYFCLSVWSIGCAPCLTEIPHLISLFKTARSDISLVFVSQFSEKACINSLLVKNIDSTNMISICNMSNLISGIYNELGFKMQVFPIHLIIDSRANPIAYFAGNIEKQNDSERFMNFIKELE